MNVAIKTKSIKSEDDVESKLYVGFVFNNIAYELKIAFNPKFLIIILRGMTLARLC